MSAVDEKKYEAEKLLPQVADIVWSDLMKAHHYIEKALKIAILSGNETTAQELASISVRLASDIKYIQSVAQSKKPIKDKE